MFKIRDVIIPNNIVLAPMAGYTNLAYREICKMMGAGLIVAEMVSDKAICFNNKRTLDMLKVSDIEHPIAIQLFGSDVDSMVKAAIVIDKYSNADIIDINMGCPVNKVIKANAGSALLLDVDKIYDIASNIVKNVSKPVTAKIRIGYDFEHINCVEVAKTLEKAGISAITVHARTRSQFYSGKADWKYIKMVKDAVNIPVIGNGDVTNIDDAINMFKETGCDAIAIARATLGNPFIFRELNAYFNENKIIDKPTNKEIYDTIVQHYNKLVELKGEHIALLEMRGNIAFYIKGMKNSSKVKDLVNKMTNFNDINNLLKEYLGIS